MADFDFSYETTEPSNDYRTVIDGDIKTAWALIRDFGGWEKWTKMFRNCKIIGDGVDKIGCTRQFSPPTHDNIYNEQLTYRDEEKTTLKYNLNKIEPALKGLAMVHIHIVLVPVGDNKVQIDEIAWNEYTDDAPEGFAAGLKKIQNDGAQYTYQDLANYIEQQGKKASTETTTTTN
jgi:hypothetical protein